MSRSGYYAHRRAKPSVARVQQQVYVNVAFVASGGSHGSRPVMYEL
ncbi:MULTISPECIES: hypothetical protein [Burkholderiaceae]|nr:MULTISPECIES: hypothetical protein [Burkholderiaceae]MCG1040922.1 hypothetical protein [Mycetohabitans sp. B7]